MQLYTSITSAVLRIYQYFERRREEARDDEAAIETYCTIQQDTQATRHIFCFVFGLVWHVPGI